MKKTMKILLALVLVLAVAGGAVLYTMGPSLKLSAMMKEAYTTPDTDFTLQLETPEDELRVEGSRLTSVGQTEVKFLTPGGQELTRVVVDGQTAYLDLWPLFDVLGKNFFDWLEMENPMEEVPDFLRQSGLMSLKLDQCSTDRATARTALLTALKDSLMPDLLDEAQAKRAEEGVIVTWEPEELAAVLIQAGERLNAQDRELYVQWTNLMKAWGTELTGDDSLMVRMVGKLIQSMAQQREKDQALGVAELHDHIAEQCAALADQVKNYGAPELHVWETDHSIAQRLKWNSAEGESRIFLELSPSARTSVELPGETDTPAEQDMT